MEDKRVQTLEALSAFIKTQKTILAQTQADIEKLRGLGRGVWEHESFPSGSNDEISAFKLSKQPDVAAGPPKDLEWTLFASLDPEPLRQLANSSRSIRAEQNQPSPFQASPLSNLQRFVKIARKSIVDPVLEDFACESSELEDERVDVIVEETSYTIADNTRSRSRTVAPTAPPSETPPSIIFPPTSPLSTTCSTTPPPPVTPITKNKKPKSETYKMAWSLSEQHLLERLLEEIPKNEKHRFVKISNAMNGRRTPKQVASRVQKYMEKLKQFGLA